MAVAGVGVEEVSIGIANGESQSAAPEERAEKVLEIIG